MGKIGKIIYYSVITILVLVFFVMILQGKDFKGAEMGIWVGLFLAGLAVLATLVSSVIFLINNPTSAVKMLLGVGVLILVCVISYVMAPGNIEPSYIDYGVESVQLSKRIDMGLYLSVFLSVVAIGSVLVSEGVALFKN